MHPKNSFVTLTYSDENLKSTKLVYRDFQLFVKKLRKIQNEKIGIFVTGEYGDKTKRPHWHALLFGWSPADGLPKYTNDCGDQVYSSETLSRLWRQGICEYGSVTFKSAGYCARYAAKKLSHGKDQDHEFHPISKKSSKHAIGKKWIEKFWPDVFSHGRIILADGSTCGIPRYYEKWFKEHHPVEHARYVERVKEEKIKEANEKSLVERTEYYERLMTRMGKGRALSPNEVRNLIAKSKFKILQDNLKL